jgi:hypothetical protein
MSDTTSDKRKQIFVLMASIVGIILFWRGLWDLSVKAFSPEASLLIGLTILGSIAIVDRKQILKFLS